MVAGDGSYPPPVIAIDGPGGSGKGTISQAVALRLGWHLLDSGVLYRLLALAAQHHAIHLQDADSLVSLTTHLDVEFRADHPGEPTAILLEGELVSELVRTEAIGEAASAIATLPAVRNALLERQRAFREPPGLVADGRDMGSVVFPDACLKIFLTASPEERAKRRYKQLKEKGMDVNLRSILKDITARDARDSGRSVAPLEPSPDAEILDTTGLGIDEVVECVMELSRRRCTED